MNKKFPFSRWSLTDVRRQMEDAVKDRLLNGGHNFTFDRFLILVSFLCVLCGNSFAQEWKTVHPGVEYAQVDHKIGSDPVKINLLRLDLKKVRLDVHHAFDKAIGVEPTSAIAMRHNATAAINAGFFRLDKTEFAGDAAGILQIDRELISESVNDRIALAIFNTSSKTSVDFGHLKSAGWVGVSPNLSSIPVDGVDRESKRDEAILYTRRFAVTPKSEQPITELIFSRCMHVCREGKVLEGFGGSSVPNDGYVLSLHGTKMMLVTAEIKSRLLETHLFTVVGNIVELKTGEKRRFDKAEDIVAGVPQLIKNGKIDITWEQEKASKSFAEMRHPRTAVAKLKDGKFLMITVDGRQPGVSVGMTLQELADYILSLGATDAMNLDGGGSTTMFLDGKIVNTPSDKDGERKVSDAIVVTLRKNSRK